MGGAEGVLATDEFQDKRIVIDFRHDRIDIRHSRGERTPANFIAIPLERSRRDFWCFMRTWAAYEYRRSSTPADKER